MNQGFLGKVPPGVIASTFPGNNKTRSQHSDEFDEEEEEEEEEEDSSDESTEEDDGGLGKGEIHRIDASVHQEERSLDGNDDETNDNIAHNYEEKSDNHSVDSNYNDNYIDDSDEGEYSSDDESNYSDDDRRPTNNQPLSPEIQELAQIVATCLYNGGKSGATNEIVHNKIETLGSTRLKTFWRMQSKQASAQKQGYTTLLDGKLVSTFREYRNQLLAVMIAIGEPEADCDRLLKEIISEYDADADAIAGEQKVRVCTRVIKQQPTSVLYETKAKVKIESTKQPYLTGGKRLSPELQDLALILAKCLYERPKCKKSGVPKKVVHEKIMTEGSFRLKKYWKIRTQLPHVIKLGYCTLISGALYPSFRKYRDQLLEAMKLSAVQLSPQLEASAQTTVDKQNVGVFQSQQRHVINGKPAVVYDNNTGKKMMNKVNDIVRSGVWDEESADDADGNVDDNGNEHSTDYDDQQATRQMMNSTMMQNESPSFQLSSARKRGNNSSLSVEQHGAAQRLKTAAVAASTTTVPSSTDTIIEDYKHDVELFFKWRHRRLEVSQEQFLDESTTCGWQAAAAVDSVVDRARHNFEAHYAFESDKLVAFAACSCANFLEVGSTHPLANFFERVAVSWKTVVDESINAKGGGGGDHRAAIFEEEQRDRFRSFMEAEKACVQSHLEVLSG
jgi:hypothetical protein